MLVGWLRDNGYGGLCAGEPRGHANKSDAIIVSTSIAIRLGLVAFAFLRLDWPLWVAVGAVAAAVTLIVVLRRTLNMPTRYGTYALLALWFAAGVWLLLAGDMATLLLTHGVAFLVVVAVRMSVSAVRTSFHVPLFVPVALVVVLLPLLTEDPWRLGAVAGNRLAWLAGVSILPLAGLLIVRIARMQVPPVLRNAKEKIDEDVERARELAGRLGGSRPGKDGRAAGGEVETLLMECYTSASEEEVDRAISAAGRPFRLRAIGRLISLIAGVLIAVWVLVYIIAWAAIPESLAAEWSQREVSTVTLDLLNFLGVDVILPVSPHLSVAAILAIVACVGFLGFVLTDDFYSTPLWDTLVHDPAKTYLLAAVSYIRLSDRASRGKPAES